MEMLVGVIKRVTVMGEVDEGGEGVSRPDGNSAGSAQRLWESEDDGDGAGSAQRVWESEDGGGDAGSAQRDWESEDDDDDESNRNLYS